MKVLEKLISSNDEALDAIAEGTTRKTSFLAHKITAQEEESISSSDSDELSIEEYLRNKNLETEKLHTSQLRLDFANSSADSIDLAIDDYYFEPESRRNQTNLSKERPSSAGHF